jgi:DNA repair protein RadC
VASLIEPFAGADAEAVATRLLNRFGSLHRALVSPQGIEEHSEDADVLRKMRAARALVLAAAKEKISRRRVEADDPDLHDYLKDLLGPHAHELLHANFLESRHGYIADECIASGTSGRLTASTRNLVARAFDLGARALILAHNHPSGSALPSPEDVAATARIGGLTAELDLALIDHLIVTRHQVFSLRAGALL